MKNIAEFTIIGRIGKVEVLNTATRFSIASNYRRGKGGSHADDTHWNTRWWSLPGAPAATSASTLPGATW